MTNPYPFSQTYMRIFPFLDLDNSCYNYYYIWHSSCSLWMKSSTKTTKIGSSQKKIYVHSILSLLYRFKSNYLNRFEIYSLVLDCTPNVYSTLSRPVSNLCISVMAMFDLYRRILDLYFPILDLVWTLLHQVVPNLYLYLYILLYKFHWLRTICYSDFL